MLLLQGYGDSQKVTDPGVTVQEVVEPADENGGVPAVLCPLHQTERTEETAGKYR